MQNEVRVGDVVAWDKVPDAVDGETALVRDEVGDYALRIADRATWARFGASDWLGTMERWSTPPPHGSFAIIALGLTGQETAADLQRLAEVYEVRVALSELLVCDHCGNEEPSIESLDETTSTQPWCTECDSEMGDPGLADEAERLHAAGWRPGMTAEDAARLLK